MVKKKKSPVKSAIKFGFLGAFIGLALTLFWPSLHPLTIIGNTLIGYAAGFILNFLKQLVKRK